MPSQQQHYIPPPRIHLPNFAKQFRPNNHALLVLQPNNQHNHDQTETHSCHHENVHTSEVVAFQPTLLLNYSSTRPSELLSQLQQPVSMTSNPNTQNLFLYLESHLFIFKTDAVEKYSISNISSFLVTHCPYELESVTIGNCVWKIKIGPMICFAKSKSHSSILTSCKHQSILSLIIKQAIEMEDLTAQLEKTKQKLRAK